jgi:general secretion pathway protein G
MNFSKFAARRRGFTLIELLIVIVVIAILALIVIPKVMGAGRKAKESALRGNLHQLRNALEQFSADTGVYPTQLEDLTLKADTPPTSGVDDANQPADIPANTYKGPYLSRAGGGIQNSNGIPVNPFAITPNSTTVSDHWAYGTGEPGEVRSASDATALDGTTYNTW